MALGTRQHLLLLCCELKKDFPFFSLLGLISGSMHWIYSHNLSETSFWKQILQENLAGRSILFIAILLLLTRGLEYLSARLKMKTIESFIGRSVTHITRRIKVFASVGACILFGFAIASIGHLKWYDMLMFFILVFYFAITVDIANFYLRNKSITNFLLFMGIIVLPSGVIYLLCIAKSVCIESA